MQIIGFIVSTGGDAYSLKSGYCTAGKLASASVAGSAQFDCAYDERSGDAPNDARFD